MHKHTNTQIPMHKCTNTQIDAGGDPRGFINLKKDSTERGGGEGSEIISDFTNS